MDQGDKEKEADLSRLGTALHFFLQRCAYLSQHPEVPPPVGGEFRWDNRGAHLFTILTGALLDVWVRAGGRDLVLPDRTGSTIEIHLVLSSKPEPSPGQELLLRASTSQRLEQERSQWRWSLVLTGASINAACP